jgi:anti-sigma factor RsiW
MADAVSENELHAFVDGALPAERRAAVEAYLAGDAAAAERVAAYRGQRDLLHRMYDPTLDEPLPDRLRPAPASAPALRLAHLAAAAVLLLIGGVAGWFLHAHGERRASAAGQELAFMAVKAHQVFTPEVRHPVEVDAKEQDHLVKWLSKRLKTELKAPALEASGYALVGGRLLSDSLGPAGLFMYEDERGRRLTLYVRRHDGKIGETAFRYALQDGVGVFYWIDSELSYALAGQVDKERLLAISRIVYDQLDR